MSKEAEAIMAVAGAIRDLASAIREVRDEMERDKSEDHIGYMEVAIGNAKGEPFKHRE